MAADSDYSEVLERLADSHQQRVADSLVALEGRVASLMADAPKKAGKLFDLEWAVSARTELRAALEETYLSEVDSVIRGYGAVSTDAAKMLGTYGDFTKLDTGVVSQLQRLSFQGFEAIGSEYLDVLANEVYQSTLTGRNFNDTVKNLRQTINGVYINSDDVEAQRLVDVAANGTAAQSAAAVKELQTKYARDRVGNNLRRYSTQMAQDSLMQFDASINTAIGKQSGATKWKYYGSTVRDSRQFCVDHAGKVFTEEEIAEDWSGSWKGKASGDPFIVRGGYNCRHHWRPVFDEEPEEAVVDNKNAFLDLPEDNLSSGGGPPKLLAKQKVINSLSSRTAKASQKPDFDSFRDPNYNGKSPQGYQLKDGEFQTRFNHGWTARSGLSPQAFNRQQLKENVTKGLTAETLTILESALIRTDVMAKSFGVPKIRSIGKSKGTAVAQMGDSVLSINHKYYNNWSKKTYASPASLTKAVSDLEVKLAESMAKKQLLRSEYDELKAAYDAASADDKRILSNGVRQAGLAYNKEVDKWNNTSKKLLSAQQLAVPDVANRFVKGGDLKFRPFTADGFFESSVDKSNTVIFHEFGHNVHQQYKVTSKNLGGKFTQDEPPLERLLDSMYKQKPFFPTKYSEVNSHEWFAENFSLYQMGRKDLMDDNLLGLITALDESNGTLSRWKNFDLIKGEYDGGRDK